MTEPCVEKHNIEKLFAMHSDVKDVVHDMRVVQAEIRADVTSTKKTVENGLKSSVSNVELLLVGLKPVIDSHAEYIKELREKEIITKTQHAHTWAKRLETTCVACAWGICIAGVSVIVWALRMGVPIHP